MSGRTLILSGGVGGAKLVLGLSRTINGDDLVVACNTGDDFDHLGLRICPDIDSVTYALSDLADELRGWGRKNETWKFISAIRDLGGPSWFNLGDMDLATHVLRTHLLKNGASLSEVTDKFAATLGITAKILPMSDDPIATIVRTKTEKISFQHYFVYEQCKREVTGFEFDGISHAKPQSQLIEILKNGVNAIIIAPSNPYVSIDPIISIPGFKDALRKTGAPIIAVCPIVGGQAIKGPAAKMMLELGKEVSALGIARHYQGLIDGLVLDKIDKGLTSEVKDLGIEPLVTDTIMTDLKTKVELAKKTIEFARKLSL